MQVVAVIADQIRYALLCKISETIVSAIGSALQHTLQHKSESIGK